MGPAVSRPDDVIDDARRAKFQLLQWSRPFHGRMTVPLNQVWPEPNWLQWGRPFHGRMTGCHPR